MKINVAELTDHDLRYVIDDAILRCYIYNRQRSPQYTADQWTRVFGIDAYLYELEYQRNFT